MPHVFSNTRKLREGDVLVHSRQVALNGYRAELERTVVIGVLVLFSSWKLLKESVIVLMEGAPPGLDASEIGAKMANSDGVVEVHDLHVWTVTSGFPALAAHVLVGEAEDCHARRRELEVLLREEYDIDHTTLQVDHAGDHRSEGVNLTFKPENGEARPRRL